jgi:hypothetical protein
MGIPWGNPSKWVDTIKTNLKTRHELVDLNVTSTLKNISIVTPLTYSGSWPFFFFFFFFFFFLLLNINK